MPGDWLSCYNHYRLPGGPGSNPWAVVELTEDSHKQMWMPPGLAYGLSVLCGNDDFLHKSNKHYAPKAEACIGWDAPTLANTCTVGRLQCSYVQLPVNDLTDQSFAHYFSSTYKSGVAA